MLFYVNYVDENDFNAEKECDSWYKALNQIEQLKELGCTRFMIHEEI